MGEHRSDGQQSAATGDSVETRSDSVPALTLGRIGVSRALPVSDENPMQLMLEPALAPYVSPDIDPSLGDDALARRAKAMACTVPLHELEANKGRMRDGEFAAYTVWELAFIAIDTVAVQMDFDRGAAHRAVIEAMLPYAQQQAPDSHDAEHKDVCQWVLDELIGTSTNRGFTVEYGDWNGEYKRRSFGFQLLTERAAPDGSVYLRATDQAINVLVGALDTDVESAQAAAEAKLENLIRRGRLSEAHYVAKEARYRTVQLGEQLRQDLAATRRNIGSVDWAGAVSPRLDGALVHISERLEMERRIADNIRQTRDRAEDDAKRAQAAELIDLLDDCQNRHMVLQRKLMEARQVFLDEQDRQVFAPPASVRLRDIEEEMLLPALRASIDEAEPVLVSFFERSLGPRPYRIGRLSTLLGHLLSPPPQRDELGVEIIEPELYAVTPYEAFPDDVQQAANEVFATVGESQPVRLSALLALALEDSQKTAHLVALLALHAFSPAIGSHLRAGDGGPLLAAWSDGAQLPATLPFYGDDLLLSNVDLGAALNAVRAAV